MSSVSQQNPVRVFVAHAFEPNDDYRRVFEYLESARNFFYRNCSVAELPPGLDKDGLKQELRKQINLAEVVVIPAAMYNQNRDWVDFELNCAKGFDKPVVVINFFGMKAKLPTQLEALGDEIIEWNERDIVDAIKRQARHEESTRWDVIEFKLD
ncbi:MAG: TIR domain-containing protein [Steroidobacteraceae bacterium]